MLKNGVPNVKVRVYLPADGLPRSHAVVENLIVKLGLTDKQAADIAEVDIDYVKKIRSELKKK